MYPGHCSTIVGFMEPSDGAPSTGSRIPGENDLELGRMFFQFTMSDSGRALSPDCITKQQHERSYNVFPVDLSSASD